MASLPASAAPLFLLLSVLALTTTSAAARPCKTLFMSYTFSSSASAADGGYFSGSAVEVSQISTGDDGQAPSRFFAVYRFIPLHYYGYRSYSSSYSAAAAATEPLATTLRLPAGIERPALPRHAASPAFGVSSLRERARDILVVVAGLLFGVGCAALTSATMYLAWYLINNRYEVCGSDGYDYVDDEDGVDGMESPKKMGFTDLPAKPAIPVAPLKEGFEGN